jgi:hypothetical protein
LDSASDQHPLRARGDGRPAFRLFDENGEWIEMRRSAVRLCSIIRSPTGCARRAASAKHGSQSSLFQRIERSGVNWIFFFSYGRIDLRTSKRRHTVGVTVGGRL